MDNIQELKFDRECWIKLARSIWPQGDNYYAVLTKTGKVRVGYTNDYPMQHGNGEELVLPQSVLPLFAIENSQKLNKDIDLALYNSIQVLVVCENEISDLSICTDIQAQIVHNKEVIQKLSESK